MDYSNFKFAKEPKKKKKRLTTSEKTYNEVYKICKGKCALCGSSSWLEYHHIYYRKERKDLINEPTNGIMLCKKHHLEVHSNKKFWQEKLIEKRKSLTHER